MSPDERQEQMAAMYQEERLTMAEIAEQFELSRARVQQILAPLNLKLHRGQRHRDNRVEVLTQAMNRVVSGETTTAEEAERLGYANARSLRWAFRSVGLKRPPATAPPHGTYARYMSKSHPCRPPCEACLEASRQKRRERYERGPRKHGTVSAYRNFGCHCDKCRKAIRDSERERRALKREKEMAT
jgi:predicted DNA-binding protein YlxM (UPF0122 family)